MLEIIDYLFERLVIKYYFIVQVLRIFFIDLMTNIIWILTSKKACKRNGIIVKRVKESGNFIAIHQRTNKCATGDTKLNAVYNLYSQNPDIEII